MEPITSSAGLVIAIGGAVAVIAALYRWLKPRLARRRVKATAASDAILGREAKYDSITGELVQPALPGIGVRMSSQEEATLNLANVVERLANSHERLDNHEVRIKRLEDASPTPLSVDVTVTPSSPDHK